MRQDAVCARAHARMCGCLGWGCLCCEEAGEKREGEEQAASERGGRGTPWCMWGHGALRRSRARPRRRPALTCLGLRVMPCVLQPYLRARWRLLPPMPQPTSTTFEADVTPAHLSTSSIMSICACTLVLPAVCPPG